MVGEVDRDTLRLHTVARFDNAPVRLPDGLHWNIAELYRQSLLGLRTAAAGKVAPAPVSVAVDSWAVDYGLLREGRLIGMPYHYRDERTAGGVEAVHRVADRRQLYERNGLQFLPFNTLYQLAADPLVGLADRALLIPDLIGYWLSGTLATERTNASTTGLLDPRSRDWDRDLCDLLGLGPGLFPDLMDAGTALGVVTPEVGEWIGATGLVVSSVGSHDTASAVVGVPLSAPDAAYISCGTWGLVGVELDRPVISEASRTANFTNEGGVDGRTRFLTNVMGTWLLSETMRGWEAGGEEIDLTSLLRQAGQESGPVTIFDVQDPRFVAPGDMPQRIADYCAEHGLPVPSGRPALVRSIVHSLAAGFARAVEQVGDLTGLRCAPIHLVGGGAQNAMLCQAVADRSGREVIAGPVEATAMGNVLVQARSLGAVDGTLEDLRALIGRTHSLTTYRPASTPSASA